MSYEIIHGVDTAYLRSLQGNWPPVIAEVSAVLSKKRVCVKGLRVRGLVGSKPKA